MSKTEKVTIACYGGCSRAVTLRKGKIHADFYLCHSKEHGQICEAKLPPLMPGKVRIVDMYAAASFWGYRDAWPDAQAAESVTRAREILAAGVTQLAIEKAKQCN